MTPGPTRVPDRVLRAGAQPMLHHRSAEFSRELSELLELIAPVFGTRGLVLPLHSTGRGAMDAAIGNLFNAADHIAVCCNGRFGEMWARMAEGYGLVVERVSTDWTRELDLQELEQVLRDRPAIRAVAVTYCDTSTGVRNDIQGACRVAHAHDALALVDGVSSIGGMPFAFDEWGVDVAVTASQKCLMSSPGVAFAAVSDRAWRAHASSTLPRSYTNFTEIKEHIRRPRPETPGTPPVHPMLQVAEALRMMHEESLSAVYKRHDHLAAVTRRGVATLGLTLQCPELRNLATTLTAIALPEGTSPWAVRDHLKATHRIETAEALGPYGANAFRIGHMGDIRVHDAERTLAALADALAAAPRA